MKPDETTTKVTDGGLKIEDFDDLKIAFLDLLDKHQKLAIAFDAYRKRHKKTLRDNATYGLNKD